MSDRDAYTDDDRVEAEYDADERTYNTNPRGQGKWVSALIALAGVWLVLQALLFDILPTNFWNDIIVGVALVALGGYNYNRRSNERLASVGVAVLAALLGLWLVVSPWVYGVDVMPDGVVTTEIGFWNDVIVGLLVLMLGAYSAYEARDTDVVTPAERET